MVINKMVHCSPSGTVLLAPPVMVNDKDWETQIAVELDSIHDGDQPDVLKIWES